MGVARCGFEKEWKGSRSSWESLFGWLGFQYIYIIWNLYIYNVFTTCIYTCICIHWLKYNAIYIISTWHTHTHIFIFNHAFFAPFGRSAILRWTFRMGGSSTTLVLHLYPTNGAMREREKNQVSMKACFTTENGTARFRVFDVRNVPIKFQF